MSSRAAMTSTQTGPSENRPALPLSERLSPNTKRPEKGALAGAPLTIVVDIAQSSATPSVIIRLSTRNRPLHPGQRRMEALREIGPRSDKGNSVEVGRIGAGRACRDIRTLAGASTPGAVERDDLVQ